MTPSPLPARAALVARLLIGGLLLFSGPHQGAAPPQEFAAVIESYQLLGPDGALALARALPWLETFLGLFLLFGLWTRAAAAGCALLFASFLFALAQALWRRLPLDNCGCFGAGVHMPLWATLTLDAFLLAGCVLVFRLRGEPSLDKWAQGGYK